MEHSLSVPEHRVTDARKDGDHEQRTEVKLRNLEQLYKLVTENVRDVIWTMDNDMHFTYISPSIRYLRGLDPADAIKETFEKTLTAESYQAVLNALAARLENEAHGQMDTVQYLEVQQKNVNGSQVWVELAIQAILNSEKERLGFLGVSRDITERKRTEEVLNRQLVFDELMARVLIDFATCSYADVDARVENALKQFGLFIGVDHALVTLAEPDSSTWKISHEWFSPDLADMLDARNPARESWPWTEANLLRRQVIRLNSIDDYHQEAWLDRQSAVAIGAKSILNVPITGSSKVVNGGVVLRSYRQPVIWSYIDVVRLRMVGDAIAGVIERQRAEEKLRRHNEHLEELVRERTSKLEWEINERRQADEELRKKTEALESFNRMMIAREKRVIELKEEINDLCAELNRPSAYPPLWRQASS